MVLCNQGRQKLRKGGGVASLQRKCSALWQAWITIGGLEDASVEDNINPLMLLRWVT